MFGAKAKPHTSGGGATSYKTSRPTCLGLDPLSEASDKRSAAVMTAKEDALSMATQMNVRTLYQMRLQDEVYRKFYEGLSDQDRQRCTTKAKIWWRSYSIEFRELLAYIVFLAIYVVSLPPHRHHIRSHSLSR